MLLLLLDLKTFMLLLVVGSLAQASWLIAAYVLCVCA